MKQSTHLAQILAIFAATTGISLPCLSAEFSPGYEVRFLLPTPKGDIESCYLPKYFDGSLTLEDDRKDELKLCRMSAHKSAEAKLELGAGAKIAASEIKKTETKEMVLCPKLTSTVPGTNFLKLPDKWDQKKAQDTFCKLKVEVPIDLDDEYSLEAKLKSTMGGASARAVVSYYHFSRLLNIGRVAPAVYRTLLRETHEAVIKHGVAAVGNGEDHISQNWRALDRANTQAAGGKGQTELYIDGGKQLFGALMLNEKGEEKYTEVSGVGDFATRYQRFMGLRPYLRVASTDGVTTIAGSRRIEKLAPVITQMRDVSDMILLDTLLSQADRIGNIHYKIEIVELLNGVATLRPLSKDEKKAAKDELAISRSKFLKLAKEASDKGNARQAASYRGQAELIKMTEPIVIRALKKLDPSAKPIVTKVMILKDNDAGISGRNPMRQHSALEQVRHMNPETYARFLMLADAIISGRFKTFATDTLMFRARDYEGTQSSLKENTIHALKVLKTACKNGSLKFDLTMKFDSRGEHVAEAPPACE